MDVSVETTAGLGRRLTMTIPREKVESEVQTQLKSLATTAKIQGFRPGKVPFSVIKKKYQKAVEQDVLGKLMQSTFYEAVVQEKLRPAGMPHIEPMDETKESESLQFSATFEVYPEVELSDLSSLVIEKPVVDISEKAVREMIDTIRKQRTDWKDAGRAAQDGDRVTVDFEGKIDGETFEGGGGEGMTVEIGSKRMIPGFEEKLVGVSVGDDRELNLTFPEDYHSKDVAGKPVVFKINAKKVETPELPELNDEFIETLGIQEGGVAAFSEQVKNNMTREATQSTMTTIKQNVMDALLVSHNIEVPKILVDNEIEALMQQRKDAVGQQEMMDLKADLFEEQARRRVALGLILSEIVTKNELKVEPSAIRETIEGIAAGYDHPEEVVKYYYGDKQRLAEIENVALEQKIVDLVISQSKVTEKAVSFSELAGQK